MLSASDIGTLLLSPDPFTERPDTDTPDWAVFKECPKQRRRAKKSDRWANSGGMKGSRDLPYNSASPFVRRRYGSVFAHNDPHAKGKRYYEYTLLHQLDDGTTIEDKSATLFHILPGPGETDRGRRAVAPCDEAPRSVGRTTAAPERTRQQQPNRASYLTLHKPVETMAPRFSLGPMKVKSEEPPAACTDSDSYLDTAPVDAAPVQTAATNPRVDPGEAGEICISSIARSKAAHCRAKKKRMTAPKNPTTDTLEDAVAYICATGTNTRYLFSRISLTFLSLLSNNCSLVSLSAGWSFPRRSRSCTSHHQGNSSSSQVRHLGLSRGWGLPLHACRTWAVGYVFRTRSGQRTAQTAAKGPELSV